MNKTLELSKLTKNPFTLVPGEKVTIWAGYKELKRHVLDIVESCRSDKVGLSEFVVLHGDYGAGKSHVLRYLKYWIESEKKDEFQSKVVYLESLKLAPKMDFLAIYRCIIEELKDHMRETAYWLDKKIEESVVKGVKVGMDEQIKLKAETYRDKSITPTFPSLSLLLKGIKEGNEQALKILSGGGTEKSLRDFDMHSPIDNEFSSVRCLGAYINLCTQGTTALNEVSAIGRNKAFYLFLDEVEMLNDFKASEVISINIGIRDLINACPENMCLLLGLTAEVRELATLFDRAVLRRMSREPNAIQALDVEQAVSFLKEVLKYYRSDSNDPDEYPFREAALKKIAEETTDKTAGGLFRNCRRVLERAVLENRLKPSEWIEKKDVEDLIPYI